MISNFLRIKKELRMNFFTPSTPFIKRVNKSCSLLTALLKNFTGLRNGLYPDFNGDLLSIFNPPTWKRAKQFCREKLRKMALNYLRKYFISSPRMSPLTFVSSKGP